MNGLLAALGVTLIALGAVVFALRASRRRRRDRRMQDARAKAAALVTAFAHTPVRGASRDRSRPGKARRRERRA